MPLVKKRITSHLYAHTVHVHCLHFELQLCLLEKNMVKTLDLRDEIEWDTKTIASAVKGYFRYTE